MFDLISATPLYTGNLLVCVSSNLSCLSCLSYFILFLSLCVVFVIRSYICHKWCVCIRIIDRRRTTQCHMPTVPKKRYPAGHCWSHFYLTVTLPVIYKKTKAATTWSIFLGFHNVPPSVGCWVPVPCGEG